MNFLSEEMELAALASNKLDTDEEVGPVSGTGHDVVFSEPSWRFLGPLFIGFTEEIVEAI